jgi:hypothetical protein
MKKIASILIAALLISIIILLNRNNDYFFSRAICYEKKEMNNYYFYSVVTNKYTDSTQHNYNTLLIKDLSRENIVKIYIENESGGFYARIFIGDTIIKEKGSLVVKNKTQGWIDTLNYKCKD